MRRVKEQEEFDSYNQNRRFLCYVCKGKPAHIEDMQVSPTSYDRGHFNSDGSWVYEVEVNRTIRCDLGHTFTLSEIVNFVKTTDWDRYQKVEGVYSWQK